MSQENKTQESKPKRSWIKSLIFEEDKNETVAENSTASAPESSAKSVNNNSTSKFTYSEVAPSNPQNIPSSMMIPNSNGMFDERFYNSFLQVIESNNVEGVDYFEFSKALKALATTGMAEPLKYQSAFSTLKATSTPVLTKDTLLKTADFYIEKLGQEEADFNKEMEVELQTQVTSRLENAKNKQDQILRMQEEISKLQSEVGVLNAEAQQAQSKIESTGKNFKVSMEVLKSQINADKQNINNYIQ